jgi:hypothetical protein
MIGMTCSTQWEDEECVWIKKPQGWKSLVRSLNRLVDNIKSGFEQQDNIKSGFEQQDAGGEASNPVTKGNFTASCVPLTFFSNQTIIKFYKL